MAKYSEMQDVFFTDIIIGIKTSTSKNKKAAPIKEPPFL